MKEYDVAIIGGGPGGSNLGTLLAQKGVSVAIFERENYPRFHIGESLLPASMPILMETGFYDTLNSGKYIQKYGARFVDYTTDDEIYFGFGDSLRPEFPMAFEVVRSEFDKDLLQHAQKSGVTLYQPERVKAVEFFDSHVVIKTNERECKAKFVVDATGRDSFIAKQMKTRKVNQDLNNVAVFAHYTGVKRNAGKNAGDIIIGLLPQRAWSWIIPFQGERTSVGVVCSSEVFKGGTDLSAYLDEAFKGSPKLTDYMQNAERASEVTVISNYSHTTESFVGDRWMLIGDAAVFLDPIFSSGVHVALTSGKFASEALLKALGQRITLREQGIHTEYEANVHRGVKRFHSLISLFYGDNFVSQMKKTLTLKNTRQAFTSAVAGDMWNDENFIFQRQVL
jgi:flavin-dependent dehydrogenase